jgi:transcription initiation factor TFIIIB Brf1 subunit/transcription initiation factor TFIIB
MTAKLITFNGQKKSVPQWAKDTGLSAGTIRERLGLGWSIERALTTAPDSGGNRDSGNGRRILVGVTASYYKVWNECGEKEFERQLAEAFKKDALKTVSAFQFLLPKNNEATNEKQQTAIQINNVIDPNDFQSRFTPIGVQ